MRSAFFHPICAAFLLVGAGHAGANDKTITADEGRVAFDLPPGWAVSQQKTGNSDAVAGYESSDRKTSFYVLRLPLQSQTDTMYEALDRTVKAFDADENWIVHSIETIKDVTVGKLPAAYTRVEMDLQAGDRKVPFVFHFTMVGANEAFYMLQASTIKPVREVREQELFRMMKSFKVKKGE